MSRLAWQARPPVLGGLREARWLRVPALAAGLLFVDLLIALAVIDARFQRLALLGLAVVALALVFRFPLAAVLGLLFLVASITVPGQWRVPLGPVSLRLEELVLGALLVVAFVRPRRAWWGGVAGGALAAFVAVVVMSTVLAMLAGRVTFSDAFASARLFAPVLLFFVLVRLFPRPEDMRRVLFAAAIMAALSGLVAVFIAAPGSPVGAALNLSGDESIRGSQSSGMGIVNRVRLSGTVLAYGLFWYVALRAVAAGSGHRLRWVAMLVPMAAGIALSFNRNMWAGLAIGFVVVLLLSRGPARRYAAVSIALIVAAGSAFVLSGRTIAPDSPLRPIVERGATLFQPGRESQESSFQDRVIETRRATAAYREHPITGIGPGASFGSTGLGRTDSGAVVRTDARFLHNQYLFLLLIGGPAALLSFLTFLGTPVVAALRDRMRGDGLLALAVGILIVMVSATVSIQFADPTGSAVLALLAAGIVVTTTARRAAAAEARA